MQRTVSDQGQQEDPSWALLWNDETEVESEANATVTRETLGLVSGESPHNLRSVSSCYFSVQSNHSEASESVADLLSLWSDSGMTPPTCCVDDCVKRESNSFSSTRGPSSLWHYHDVLMHIISFMDVQDLTAFSETARRPNFECFYFLQLQLQQALYSTDNGAGCTHGDYQASFAGTKTFGAGHLTRLARLDFCGAESIVETFLNSNSTLRRAIPSHVAFLQHLMTSAMNMGRRKMHAGSNTTEGDNRFTNINLQSLQSPGSMARAAFFITLLGAASASFVSGAVSVAGSGAATESLLMELVKAFDNPSYILPSSNFFLMQLGLLSLMGAATTTQQNRNLTGRAEKMARRMLNETMGEFRNLIAEASRRASNGVVNITQHEETTQKYSITRRMQAAFDRIVNGTHKVMYLNEQEAAPSRENSTEELDLIWTANPYDHLPKSEDDRPQEQILNCCSQQRSEEEQNANSKPLSSEYPRQPQQPPVMASGCVGAYCRAVASARTRAKQILRTQRKSAFHALSLEEQQEISTTFIDACCNDESIETVKNMILVRQTVDVEGFYVGSDGTETCGLHAAAFHGAGKVLRFLCQEIHPTDPTLDGGLCDINLRDTNGWTAAHFAAGANDVETIRILARNGAVLSTEALNGYTPLQWALRLQNHEVANELRHQLLADDIGQHPWIIAAQPLTAIASRLMALIPPSHG